MDVSAKNILLKDRDNKMDFRASTPCVLVHLWRYRGGYPALTEVMNKLKHNKVTGAQISYVQMLTNS